MQRIRPHSVTYGTQPNVETKISCKYYTLTHNNISFSLLFNFHMFIVRKSHCIKFKVTSPVCRVSKDLNDLNEVSNRTMQRR